MIKQIDLSVVINYDTEKDEIISYLTTLNGVQEKKTTTTKKSTKKNVIEGLRVVREDNKLILSEDLVKELKANPEDKIVIQYDRDQESKTVFPVIGLETTFNNGGGNKLTKSNTVAYRGKANNTLAEFGSDFKVEPYKEGIYRLKEKMYYLEEMLPNKDFIRISNSAIININHVKCFNTSIIGKIIVKFKDGTEESVSKRKTSEIMKFLRERRGEYE